jgi:hypothetical protein
MIRRSLVLLAMIVLPVTLAVLTIVAVVGAARPTAAHAQTQGSYANQPSVASSSPAGSATSPITCADSDSWCKYCAQHLTVAACSTYSPGNGVASATGGVDPSNTGADGAGGGDGGGY